MADQDDMTQDAWLDSQQVADLVGVGVETVRRWIRAGELSVLDLGGPRGGYRIRRGDLDLFLRRRYRPAHWQRGATT